MSTELVARFVEHVKAEHDEGGSRGGGDSTRCCRLELAALESLMRLGRQRYRVFGRAEHGTPRTTGDPR